MVQPIHHMKSDCTPGLRIQTKENRLLVRESGVCVRIGGFEPSTSCLSSKRSKPTELNPHISTRRKHKACERTAKVSIFVIFPK